MPKIMLAQSIKALWGGGGEGEWGEATRPETEKRCYHNLQSDPLGSGFKKGRENIPL